RRARLHAVCALAIPGRRRSCADSAAFPCRAADACAAARRWAPSAYPQSRARLRSGPAMPKTVLLADDHEDNRVALQLMLEREGYRTLGARNGREAVERVLEHCPDLVVM